MKPQNTIEKLSPLKIVECETPEGITRTLVSDNGMFYLDGFKQRAILMNRGSFDQHVNALVQVHGWSIKNVEYITE